MERPTKEKAAASTPAALSIRLTYNSQSNHKQQSNFDKSGLMSPPVMLDALDIRYLRAGDRLAVHCPFHKGGEERTASLMMNLRDGHYKCFTCGEKGGDVIAFYRAVTGAGFMETLRVLGVHHG